MTKRALSKLDRQHWHLSWGKARRLNRIFDIVEREHEAITAFVVDMSAPDLIIETQKIKEGSRSEKT